MAYTKQTWNDGSAGGTPINATRLNHMEDGINDAYYDDYTTSETKIGTWNGEDLYRKVVHITSFPSATTGNYAHGISNLKWVTSLSGVLKDGNNWWTIPITRISYTSYQVELRCDATNIIITTDTNRTSNEGYIIIEYTKTS